MTYTNLAKHDLTLIAGLNFFSDISAVYITGYNSGVSTVKTLDSLNTAAGAGLPAAAAATTISSGSTADTSAGTGARTVLVTGLNSAFVVVSETATLNGQTGVSLTNQYLRINDVEVMTAGSGGKNAGILYIGTGTITTGVPAATIAGIAAGDNRMKAVRYSVPTGFNLLVSHISITGVDVSASLGTGVKITIDLKQLNGSTRLIELIKRYFIDSTVLDTTLAPALVIPGGTDIWMEVTGTVSASASARIGAYLVAVH